MENEEGTLVATGCDVFVEEIPQIVPKKIKTNQTIIQKLSAWNVKIFLYILRDTSNASP